ncbi:hypothetical protein NN561_013104 [Cricetulus griseus]
MHQGDPFFPGSYKASHQSGRKPGSGRLAPASGLPSGWRGASRLPRAAVPSCRLAACAGISRLARPPPHLQLQPPLATPGGPHEVIPRRSSTLGASRGGRRSALSLRPPHLPAAPDARWHPE